MMVDVPPSPTTLKGVQAYWPLWLNLAESIVSVAPCWENTSLLPIFFHLYLGTGYPRMTIDNLLLMRHKNKTDQKSDIFLTAEQQELSLFGPYPLTLTGDRTGKREGFSNVHRVWDSSDWGISRFIWKKRDNRHRQQYLFILMCEKNMEDCKNIPPPFCVLWKK